MDNYKNKPVLNTERSPWTSLFSLIFLVLAGLLLGQYLGSVIVNLIYGFDLETISYVYNDPSAFSEAKVPLMVIQAIGAFFAFMVAPVYHLYFFHKKTFHVFINKESFGIIPILLAIFITISFMIVNSVFIEWNENIRLPEFLAPFEAWARDYENKAQKMTSFMTDFNSLQEYLLGMVVIAIIPAIGEELLFRGMIQNIFFRITGNVHTAIILAGFIFSVIHFQFFGLVPRMFLGIIFGYLYVWSGSLLMPIIAHFINNGLTVTLMYLQKTGIIDYDIESETSASWTSVFLFLIIGIFLVQYYRRYFIEKEEKG